MNDKYSKRSCSNCIHRKDVLVPCDWLKKQETIILKYPHFVNSKEQEKYNDTGKSD